MAWIAREVGLGSLRERNERLSRCGAGEGGNPAGTRRCELLRHKNDARSCSARRRVRAGPQAGATDAVRKECSLSYLRNRVVACVRRKRTRISVGGVDTEPQSRSRTGKGDHSRVRRGRQLGHNHSRTLARLPTTGAERDLTRVTRSAVERPPGAAARLWMLASSLSLRLRACLHRFTGK